MNPKWPWFERTFDFNFPPEKFPDLLIRLKGTRVLVAESVKGISGMGLKMKYEDTWSIQENIGHLTNLEPLWTGRIEDILAGLETMREADLSNQGTVEANYNQFTIDEVVLSFVTTRNTLIQQLTSLSPDQWGISALHPRLKTSMRIVDLCLFVAEHDDYHLARIEELKTLLPEGV